VSDKAIAIQFDGRERLAKRLAKIRERSGNLKPVLTDCGEIMRSSIEENFLREGRYESVDSWRGGNNRWQELSPVTIKQREKSGRWPGKKLQISGQLAASITYNVNGNSLEIGSNKVYAAIHQFGGPAGRNNRVTIPGRPYLVIQNEDVDEMIDIAGNYITGDWNMAGRIYCFWAVLRPDGQLMAETFSNSKFIANWKASRLCKKQLKKRWRKVKAQDGYRVVSVRAEVASIVWKANCGRHRGSVLNVKSRFTDGMTNAICAERMTRYLLFRYHIFHVLVAIVQAENGIRNNTNW
jgi:phage virion morphogenesis protein